MYSIGITYVQLGREIVIENMKMKERKISHSYQPQRTCETVSVVMGVVVEVFVEEERVL